MRSVIGVILFAAFTAWLVIEVVIPAQRALQQVMGRMP